MAFMEIKDLHLYYETTRGPLRAVEGFSLSFQEEGKTLGIIGESGSGKTSLSLAIMRSIPGNVSTYQGSILFEGRDLMRLSAAEFRKDIRWKKISMVFQGAMNSFNPVIQVGRQVVERLLSGDGISPRKAGREAESLLETVGLSRDVAYRYPHELSGGMKQRAPIAMALYLKPRLIVLDEPTSALDVSIQAQIMNLLKQLKWNLGISMILITHDIALASDICDYIAVIHGAKLMEYGPAENILINPQGPYTQKLLASIPRLHGDTRPQFLSGAPCDLVSPPPGCRFQSRCPSVFEPCREKEPPWLEVAPAHWTGCWLYAK